MPQLYFITGTDTDAGKTYVCRALMATLKQRGRSVIGLKPVAAGAYQNQQQWQNEDALQLMERNSKILDYSQVNPFCFPQPIAPHIAAEINGAEVTLDQVKQNINSVINDNSDVNTFFVEGAGGWLVPLNLKESFADIPKAVNAKVILVVGMKLGCINHALLSAQAITERGSELIGWVANQIQPDMPVYQENLDTLRALMSCPLLGELKYNEQVFQQLKL